MSEQDALNVAAPYEIIRSGNLIERVTLNNVAADKDCRLLRIVYGSHGRIVVQALNDHREVMHEIGLVRTNHGFHMPQLEIQDEMEPKQIGDI